MMTVLVLVAEAGDVLFESLPPLFELSSGLLSILRVRCKVSAKAPFIRAAVAERHDCAPACF